MSVNLDFCYILILLLVLGWTGQIESKFEIQISKYQLEKFKNAVSNLDLDPRIFYKTSKPDNFLVEEIQEINEKYSVLLDFLLSFESWLNKFSREYHEGSFKNKTMLSSIMSLTTEFEQVKIHFNKFGKSLDTFIDMVLADGPKIFLGNERGRRNRLKKEVLDFQKKLFSLNLDINQLIKYQHQLIRSSSLYVIKLDEASQNKTSTKGGRDMRGENGLYDLWVFYEHHRLPSLKEKIIFISKSLQLLIQQNRIILEFLLDRQIVISNYYFKLNNYVERNSEGFVDKLEELNGERRSTRLRSFTPVSIDPELGKSLQESLKCLFKGEGINLSYNMPDYGGGNSLIGEMENVISVTGVLIDELEGKCIELNKNLGNLSSLSSFVAHNLTVNTTNINQFFYTENRELKKYVFGQITYQVNQLNTISEYIYALEFNLKYYHYYNMSCYRSVIGEYLKETLNIIFETYRNSTTEISGDNMTGESEVGEDPTTVVDDPETNSRERKVNSTISDEMINFMFNSSEVANFLNYSDLYGSYPTFGTRYTYEIFLNSESESFPPLNETSGKMELFMEKYLSSLQNGSLPVGLEVGERNEEGKDSRETPHIRTLR
ncbi:hypothetical protein HWI79_2502 [Cryptosporidium felis]|nr:hypothetical protein HWI79_2502 [Cryptosporidium felis]